MRRWAPYFLAGLLGVPGAVIVWRLNSRINELEPKAEKYDHICNAVRISLETDIRLVGSAEAGLLSRVAGDRGDDSYVMLERCLPAPFPMDEWTSCLRAGDEACQRRVLSRAAGSIPPP